MSERAPGDGTSMERAYRRLMACYPWEHRREYEDEMVGVLLDDAPAGRRSPPARDIIALLGGALRARLRYAADGLATSRWRDAAAAFGLLAALAMLAYALRPLMMIFQFLHWGNDTRWLLSWHSWPRAIVWAAVVAAAVAGWRHTAAGIATAAAALEVTRLATEYAGDEPIYAAIGMWPVALAVLGAAAMSVPAARSGVAAIGRLRLALLTGAVLLWAGAPTVILVHPGSSGMRTPLFFTGAVRSPEAMISAAAVALGAAALLGTPAWLRRRLLALLAPVAATLLVTRLGVETWMYATRDDYTRTLAPAGWLIVLLLAPLALTLAVAIVHRRERTLRFLALGRAADRRRKIVE
jgi:hypothetical protein